MVTNDYHAIGDHYARHDISGTVLLAYRDIPDLLRTYDVSGPALDFGCGNGKSTRFLRGLGFDVVGVDVSQSQIDHARALDLTIHDYYWTHTDYLNVLGSAGFQVLERVLPLGRGQDGLPWRDERNTPPFALYVAQRPGAA